jgi:hypothetical protein
MPCSHDNRVQILLGQRREFRFGRAKHEAQSSRMVPKEA